MGDFILNYKNFFFDFDGVLADSLEIKSNAFYELYKPYGKSVAEKVLSHHLNNGGVSRYNKLRFYHQNYLNKDLSKKELDTLADKFSNLVVKKVVLSKEVPGAKWFLKKHEHINKWIVSATPENEIRDIVYKRGDHKYFKGIYGSPTKKEEIVSSIIKQYNLKKQETLFLGDALADFEAANLNEIDFFNRRTKENRNIFKKIEKKKKFDDFFELDKLLSA